MRFMRNYAYSSSVFSKEIIEQLGNFGLLEASQGLIYQNISISTSNPQLNNFLLLLYQPASKPAGTCITLERWNNH